MEWRKEVEQIAAYVPGKSIEEVKQQYGLEEVHRLASNENPLGPSEKAQRAMQKAVLETHLYPDTSASALREVLAETYHVSADEIMTGNGADNVISIVVSAYVNEGDEVLYCTPTFPAYRSSTLLMGGVPVEVPLREDFTFDLHAMKENITEKTKLIFICNPNNPTGTIIDHAEMEAFIRDVPKDVLVVLDEAYIEYVDVEGYKTGMDLFKEGYNVLTIRTFSKFYSLAGLRVGYAIGTKKVLEPMLRLREPFALNRVAIAGAVESIQDVAFGEKHVKMNREEKVFLTEQLEALGCKVFPSHTNFIFVDMKQDGVVLFEKLLEKGFIIRPCAGWGLQNYVRISIGTHEQNKQFIDRLKDML